MKQINFLSKSGSQSMGHRVTTLALTVGSPSAHRRSTMLKLISVLVLILTFGVGNVWGAEGTEHNCTTGNTREVVLNNKASISPISITNLSYPVKKVAVTCNYNKSTAGVTVSCTVNNEAFGTPQTINTSTTTTFNFEGSSTSGDVVISFVNNTNASSKMGTFKVTAVVLTEGASASSTPTITAGSLSPSGDFGFNLSTGVAEKKSFTVSGSNLTANISVTPPTGYEISTSENGTYQTSAITLTQSSGSVSSTTIWARLRSRADINAGSYSGNIACTSTGATARNIAVSGSVPFTVTWKANGTAHATTYVAYATGTGTTLGSLPTDPDPEDYSCTGNAFFGWYDGEAYSHASAAPSVISTSTKITSNKTYNAVFATASSGGTQEVNDALNRATTGVTGTDYSSWSNKKASSDAIYAGNSAGGNSSIQLRSNNSNSGVVTTSSGGKAKKVTVVWNSNTASGRTLDIYGKNSAYSTASDLYGDNKGTKLGSIVYGTSTELTITGDYEYIGMRSNSGAMYLTSVTIKWEAAGGTTYSNYATSCCTPLGSINGSVSGTNQRSIVLQWNKLSGVASSDPYALSYKINGSSDEPSTDNVSIDASGAKVVATISGLACSTAYDFMLSITGDADHCPKDTTFENKSTSAAMTLPTLTYATGLTAGGANITPSWASAVSHDGSVSYVSSDPSVVQIVNASTGEAKPVGAGTATITATYAQSTNNCEASKTSNTISVSGDVTVTFNANGGGGSMDNQSIPFSTATALTANAFTTPSSCKYFYGWATSQEAANAGTRAYEDGESVTITAGMNLYAIWKTYNYTVTKGTGTGAGTFSLSANNVDCGGSITVTATPDATHKGSPTVTISPTDKGEVSGTTISNITGAITVDVEFAAKTSYAITWKVNDAAYAPHQEEEDGKVNGDALVYEGNTITTLPTAPADNTLGCANTFMGWSKHDYKSVKKAASDYDDLFSDAEHAPEITEATTFYAVFATQSGSPVENHNGPSWERSGTDNTVTSGYTFSATASAKTDYYQDASSGTGELKLYHTSTPIFSSKPSSVTLTASIGAGNDDTDFENYVYARLLDQSGNGIGNAIQVTNHITNKAGDTYTPTLGLTGITSAYGIMLYHEKESGQNIRYYSFSLSYTTGGTTTTDYVTECAAVEAPTFSPAAGEYHEAKNVEISCATEGYDAIRYTINGEDPTKTTGTVYSSAITVDETTTIKAIAVKGDNVSDVVSATYTITYPRKVTFDAGAGTLSIAPATSITEEAYGEGITLPSATPSSYCVAEGWTFAGWATTNSTSTAPTIVSGTYTPESDITLYAVYKLGDENYHLVTELPTGEDIPGKYVMVYTDGKVALEAATVSGKAYQLYGASISAITDGVIDPENIDASYRAKSIWDVTYESDHWIFKNDNTSKYLYGYISGNYHNISIQSNKPTGFNVSLSNGYAVISSADAENVTVFYSTTDSKFEGTDGDTKNIHLYKQSTPTYSSTPVCCDDEVTVSKADNPSTGTFTINKSGVLSTCAGSQVVTVNCTPNPGYHVDEVTETIGTDVTIEETAENVYTVTYAKNVSGTSTISVTFAETLTPSFQISQNAFEIGDVAVGATIQRQFTISAAHLEGTSLSITSSNDKFTVSPTSLTIKDDGSVEEATVTVTLNTAEANIGGPYSATITLADEATTPNTATVSLTNATIKHQYNVKWYNGTDLLSEANYLDGATISVIPTAASCDPSISHVGWLPNATIDGKQADAPAGLVANEDIPAVTADVEYHAVFAKVGEASWRSTALAELTASDIFVIAETTGSYALSSANGTSSAPAAPSITITDGKITSEVTAAMKWNVSGNATDGYTFYPNGSTTTWLYCNNTNDGVRVGTNANKVFKINGGYLKNSTNNRYVGVYKTNPDWRCYDNTTGNIAGQSFAYYKYIAPETKDYMTTCAVTFTATYEAGAGTGDDYEDAILIEKNADYTVLGNDITGFMKTDYRFSGWKCGDDDYAAGATYENVTADLTFVAQWTEKEEAGLEYETSAYEVIQNGSFAKPTLTNPNGLDVTYSSSNTEIATVDAEGNVTLVTNAIGSTTITAASEATDTYKAGEASYTLSVASKWALTYTSNVALVENSDTKASSATVNGYDAMKCGTTGVAGAMEITVPKNTEKLHIHAAGWKNETVTISITGATASPNSIVLTADDAITGSSPFTLSKPSTFYKEITLSNITEATTLTLTATSGNRFVVYGVNEEGGIWELPAGTTDASTLPNEVNVLVGDGKNLNVNADKTLDNLIVEAGGTVSGTGNLTVNDLTIKTSLGAVDGSENPSSTNGGGKSGEILNPDNITANGDVWIEIELTQESQASYGWYAFSVPFPVDALNGVYYGDTKLTNEVGYAIMSYHGDIRATGEYGWKKFRGIMEPGVFYVITVGNTDYKTLRFKKVADSKLFNDNDVLVGDDKNQMNVNAYTCSGEGTSTDAGWNGLGNPYLAPAKVSGVDLQLYDHDLNRFWQYEGNNVNMMVGRAFFYQYQSSSSITINMSDEGIALAPARAMSSIEQTTFKVYLRNEAGRLEDKVFLRTSEDATNDYESGRDMAKMSMGTAKCAQMWVPAYGTQLCAADFPLVNDKAEYPLIINTLAAGTYTISAAETSENATLYLTKNGRIYWNLTMGACELDLNQGQNNEYGLVLRAEVPAVTTGIENGELLNGENGVQKVVIDEHVYILRGGEMYDMTGKMVK